MASYSYELGIIAQIENDYQGLFYLNNDFVQKKNTLAYLYLNKRFNEASEEILHWYKNINLFLSLNPKFIKQKADRGRRYAIFTSYETLIVTKI